MGMGMWGNVGTDGTYPISCVAHTSEKLVNVPSVPEFRA